MRLLAWIVVWGWVQVAAAQTCGCRAYYDNAQQRPADDLVKCNAADAQSANCVVVGSPTADTKVFVTCTSAAGQSATSPITIKPGTAAVRYFLNLASVSGDITYVNGAGTWAIGQKPGTITSVDSDVNNGTTMNIQASINVDPRDIGKSGKTFFLFYFESVGASPAFSGLWAYYTRPKGGYKWVWWALPNGNLPDLAEPRIFNTPYNEVDDACTFPCLPTLKSYTPLPAKVEINLPVTFYPYYDIQNPTLKIPVIYELYLGYVTADGYMVINPFESDRSIFRFKLMPVTNGRAIRADSSAFQAPRPGPLLKLQP